MTSKPRLQRILVPHDFEEAAETALSYALTLAEKLAGHVMVLHVYELPMYSSPEMLAVAAELENEIRRRAVEALERLAREARAPNLEVETIVRRGSPWMVIVEAAEKLPADLVVMGTHGRKGMPRLLLGSVAEKVIRSASCPVLTVRAPRS